MNDFILSLMLTGALSSGGPLPFWMTANQFGLMPERSGGLAVVQAGTQFDTSKEFQWKWGVSLAANYDPSRPGKGGGRTADFNLMADELYASAKWKVFTLDAGLKRVDIDFYGAGTPTLGSLSTTGGHIAWSGNARTMPGYMITMDPVAVPFTNGHFLIHGAWGDFKTLDNRYVQGALVHRTKVYLLFKILPQLDFQIGLDHVGVWGGTHPKYGKMPVTLENYLRVITGSHASAEGTSSDQKNVIGDQRGGEVFRLDWRGDGWKLALQHDVPYDDGSGMGLQNFPDGVNTVWFGWDDKDRWVSDLLFEYEYSRWQSGTWHERPTTEEERAKMDPDHIKYIKIVGGADNYFNNSGYRSGWTHFGRTIGLPLFFPAGTHAGTWTSSGVTLGVENNRIRAHHVGIAGKLFRKAPYKLMLTYSQNYGIYKKAYTGESQHGKPWGTVNETPLRQVSGAFVGELPLSVFSRSGMDSVWRHFNVTYGFYADKGSVLPDVMGATLGLRYTL